MPDAAVQCNAMQCWAHLRRRQLCNEGVAAKLATVPLEYAVGSRTDTAHNREVVSSSCARVGGLVRRGAVVREVHSVLTA